MSFASVLSIPLALLAPASSALQPMEWLEMTQGDDNAALWPSLVDPVWSSYEEPPIRPVTDEPEDAWQVRIEQRVTIRISPRAAGDVPPDMRAAFPEGDPRSGPRGDARFEERPMGKCVPAGGIAGVQPERGNRLLLYMRDRRVVTAELERSCRAMDFYSGFYVSRSQDGQVCVNRDKLQSRSGMKCALTQLHQLVPMRD
ncbi:hypothetical protein HT136_23345 [Novosphingobium profundi]|uniref:hypothetical protein n=1 Tax=Novosphingobium profundi TaxID=1774954 RepID=UPI001BD915CF|nr:hypothetical protein [Novosphingobium profundi]MBT0671310.1 hypothetical protein [Novosphingobium profundi]